MPNVAGRLVCDLLRLLGLFGGGALERAFQGVYRTVGLELIRIRCRITCWIGWPLVLHRNIGVHVLLLKRYLELLLLQRIALELGQEPYSLLAFAGSVDSKGSVSVDQRGIAIDIIYKGEESHARLALLAIIHKNLAILFGHPLLRVWLLSRAHEHWIALEAATIEYQIGFLIV